MAARPDNRRSPLRSANPVRRLRGPDLDESLAVVTEGRDTLPVDIAANDTRLETVRQLLNWHGGVILVGPPGTSKSWYAANIAAVLADRDPTRVRFVQFHPSYQYEDFVEGFRPVPGGGFNLEDKHLLDMCALAAADPSKTVVLVIDELSRADPARVFGEALTYIEKTKRGLPFSLTSGRTASIPPNLVILATMNPFDRGVDDVDAAFERRFAKLPFDPDISILTQLLESNGVEESLRRRILDFFQGSLSRAKNNPYARIGHTYFLHIRSEDDLRALWDYQLRFVFDKAFRVDPQGLADIEKAWNRMYSQPDEAPGPAPAEQGEQPAG